ncbi:hypothetical protein [Micromonospora sp. DT227]|uniref:hypothetical protein n=1 Tax=Micromonospora sp. DT227 TaxID=3393433 RepID=UPI003CF8AA8F
MAANIPAGALGRPVAEFLAAVDVCAEEWRRDPGHAWVGGMVAAGWWVCGHTPHPPMRPDVEATATRVQIAEDMMRAGTVMRRAGTPEGEWARGVYRMLRYAIGYTDELPLEPTGRMRAAS